jgi:hypothetical protein
MEVHQSSHTTLPQKIQIGLTDANSITTPMNQNVRLDLLQEEKRRTGLRRLEDMQVASH